MRLASLVEGIGGVFVQVGDGNARSQNGEVWMLLGHVGARLSC